MAYTVSSNFKLEIARRIKSLLYSVSIFGKKSGVEIVPYREANDFEQYVSRSEAELLGLEQSVSQYYNLLTECQMSLSEQPSTQQLIWYALGKFGFKAPDDFFSKITEDHIFEIYNSEFLQIFRNLNFYYINSYTLEELYLNEWRVLYDRNPFLDRRIATEAIRIFDGTYKNTIPIEIGPHLLSERFSSDRFLLKGEFNYFSPLFDKHGNTVAGAVLSRVEVLGSLRANPNLVENYPEMAHQI